MGHRRESQEELQKEENIARACEQSLEIEQLRAGLHANVSDTMHSEELLAELRGTVTDQRTRHEETMVDLHSKLLQVEYCVEEESTEEFKAKRISHEMGALETELAGLRAQCIHTERHHQNILLETAQHHSATRAHVISGLAAVGFFDMAYRAADSF